MTENYWIMTEDGLSLLENAPVVESPEDSSGNETEIEKIEVENDDDDEIRQMKKELDSM